MEIGPTRSMAPSRHRLCVMLVPLLLLLPQKRPLQLILPRVRHHLVHPRRLLHRLRPRTWNWLPLEVLVVVLASSMLVKCAVIVVPTQVIVQAVLLAMPPIPTTAVIPTSLHSSGSTLSLRRSGLAAANLRSTPEASASPFATAMLTAPSPVNAATVFIRTTVDRRWLEAAECFVAMSKDMARTNLRQSA